MNIKTNSGKILRLVLLKGKEKTSYSAYYFCQTYWAITEQPSIFSLRLYSRLVFQYRFQGGKIISSKGNRIFKSNQKRY